MAKTTRRISNATSEKPSRICRPNNKNEERDPDWSRVLLYWNGNADNTFTGWTDGHPFKLYNYIVEPYYSLTIECVDEAGVVLQTTERYIKAGDSYVLIDPVIKGYYFKTIEGDVDALNNVNRHLALRLVYTDKEDTGIQLPLKNVGGEIYRLNGTLVEKPAENGIYIFNGKKIIKQ